MPPINLKKISTTCYVEEKQFYWLRKISKTTGIPMATLIRQGIDLMLKKRGMK